MLVLMLFCVFVLAVSLFFAHGEKFLFDSWDSLAPDEIIYHLNAPLTGADDSVIKRGLISVGPYVLLITVFLIFIFFVIKNDKKARGMYSLLCLFLAVFLCIAACADADYKSGIISYIKETKNENASDFIDRYYVDPQNVSLSFPEKKRNLIYIFLESMECTFSDFSHGGGFPVDVISDLTDLAIYNTDFGEEGKINGFYSLPGTNWTAAGMYTASSGLPIKMAFEGAVFLEEGGFFPELTCLGDILKDEGYSNNIIMGSDADFGARRTLYENHGDYTIHDYNYMLQNKKLPTDNYKVFWGFEDNILFRQAKEEISALAKNKEPFNYTMLTVDTHFEDGYVCDLCVDKHGEQYANVMDCSARQVNDFVSWVKTQDFYENTTIVIAADHTTMDKDFCENVPKDYERKGYFCIINPKADDVRDTPRSYSSLDIFPTTLGALGVNIEGNRLGLGTNLFSDNKTLVETLGIEELTLNLEKPSDFYSNYNLISSDSNFYSKLGDVLLPQIVVNGETGRKYLYLQRINEAISMEEDITVRVEYRDERENVGELIFEREIINKNSPHGYAMRADITNCDFDVEKTVFSLYLTIGKNEERKMFDMVWENGILVKNK